MWSFGILHFLLYGKILNEYTVLSATSAHWLSAYNMALSSDRNSITLPVSRRMFPCYSDTVMVCYCHIQQCENNMDNFRLLLRYRLTSHALGQEPVFGQPDQSPYLRGWKFSCWSQIPPYWRRMKSGINTEISNPGVFSWSRADLYLRLTLTSQEVESHGVARC